MASRPSRKQPRGARVSQQPFEASRFRRRHGAAQHRQAVVAPPLVIMFRIGPFGELFDQAVVEEPANRRVQTARAEAKRPVGSLEHVSHHRIPVAILIREGNENLESVSMERKKGLGSRKRGAG